eukprot:3124236-Rhodomonas_salina.1
MRRGNKGSQYGCTDLNTSSSFSSVGTSICTLVWSCLRQHQHSNHFPASDGTSSAPTCTYQHPTSHQFELAPVRKERDSYMIGDEDDATRARKNVAWPQEVS